MADPISIASGVAGIIALAGSVVATCYKYGCAVKDAPREVQRLLNEVTSLAGVLTGVRTLVDAHSGPTSPPAKASEKPGEEDGRDPPPYEDPWNVDLESLKAPVEDCRAVLQELQDALSGASWERRGERDQKLKRAFKRLMWPLKQRETDALASRLERCKATFLSALTATNISISTDLLNIVEDIRGTLAVDRWERQLEARKAEVQRIYKWLSPVDPAVAHRAAQKLHLGGTGQWIFDHPAWKEWASSKRGLLWLKGIREWISH